MTNFAADLAVLQQAAARSQTIGADLRDELDRLHREVDAVLTESWLGRAAETFDRDFGRWEGAARLMISALDELAEGVGSSASAYLCADRDASVDLARAGR